MISFLLNDKEINISSGDANQTVLEWLRETKQLSGTKEGCGSGDCGACTVVVAEIAKGKNDDTLHYRPINSCITFMSALAGKQLITVEHLADDTLHPVQQAMVDSHGSQCGFCTPGFVMSMFSLYQQQLQQPQTLTREDINHHLSGNLCRCTGYRPIIEASLSACQSPTPDKFTQHSADTVAELKALPHSHGIAGLHIPDSRAALREALAKSEHPVLVAGSTDLGLEVTQKHIALNDMIALHSVPELNQLEEYPDHIRIGAAVTYSDMEALLLKHFPEAREWLSRLGSYPIRNQGTMGGNIANASPIGDCPPLLLALGARCIIDDGVNQQTIPIGEFFTGYRQTVLQDKHLLQDKQWLSHIEIPLKSDNSRLRIYKISKRIEDDISAVCAAFNVEINENKITAIRTGFGGVAAMPVSADAFEQALLGEPWDAKTIAKGAELLKGAFSPIDDVRSSAEYRNKMVVNLWYRFAMEVDSSSDIQVRLAHA